MLIVNVGSKKRPENSDRFSIVDVITYPILLRIYKSFEFYKLLQDSRPLWEMMAC